MSRRYGRYGQYGNIYTDPFMNFQGAQGQDDEAQQRIQQARNQPAKQLRMCIGERLMEQKQCLERMIQNRTHLIMEGRHGASAAGGETTPGDKQISGDIVAGMLELADDLPADQDFVDASSLGRRSRMHRFGYGAPVSPGVHSSKKDPIERYRRLEREIDMLLELADVPKALNQYQAQVNGYSSLADPVATREEKLMRVMGDGSGKSGLDRAALMGQAKVGGQMQKSSPQQMQEQIAPGGGGPAYNPGDYAPYPYGRMSP